jgi:peptide deformylase
MAVRTILRYPDPRLRQTTVDVTDFGLPLQTLVDDMAETMYAADGGVGLAAPQIGDPSRVFLLDLAEEGQPSQLTVFVNPVLTLSGTPQLGPEGCLSFPGIFEDILRSPNVELEAFDRYGKPFSVQSADFLAIAIQHEFDHLQGRLLIDHLSLLKRRIVHRKMQKLA